MRAQLSDNEAPLTGPAADDYLDRNKLLIREDDPARHELALKIARAEIEALERTIERGRGDSGGAPKDPIVKPATGNSLMQAKPGETIIDVFESYARQNPNRFRRTRLIRRGAI